MYPLYVQMYCRATTACHYYYGRKRERKDERTNAIDLSEKRRDTRKVPRINEVTTISLDVEANPTLFKLAIKVR